MDSSLFISNFSGFRRVPAAALFSVVVFAMAESAVALLWRPAVVGERLYSRYSPSYDYGYASDVPRLFPAKDEWRFYPNEYVNIWPFSIRRSKAANEIRIFVLGGSVSRGSGLRNGANYASQLERALDEQFPTYDWTVVNLSADGFGTTRMLSILVHMLRYEPDAIILHPHGTNEYEDERDAHYRDTLRAGINGLLLRSRLVVLLKKAELRVLRAGDQLVADVEDEQAASLHPENIRRWQVVYENNLARFMCVSRALGIPAIFVGRAERDAPGFRNDRVDRLNAPIRDARLYVDAAAALAKAAAELSEASLWYDNTHYSETGHAVMARELLSLFQSNRSLLDQIVSHPAAVTAASEEMVAHCANLLPARGALASEIP